MTTLVSMARPRRGASCTEPTCSKGGRERSGGRRRCPSHRRRVDLGGRCDVRRHAAGRFSSAIGHCSIIRYAFSRGDTVLRSPPSIRGSKSGHRVRLFHGRRGRRRCGRAQSPEARRCHGNCWWPGEKSLGQREIAICGATRFVPIGYRNCMLGAPTFVRKFSSQPELPGVLPADRFD